ncbi:putative ly6/PLAUR domain-containing protein 6 [Apostichopus japonicus]|uniref:Putative ly6/PLAUR domain-containing protein 6 n=1 Tax=Stichopus japonicus TaxID=307972 RepID=A0A2G8LPQ2_STIJA|nr:putative ly6/PLAUR domain-containing protein 6 [Apostichopus japonicus]
MRPWLPGPGVGVPASKIAVYKDIYNYGLSIATPFPDAIKCYTCEEKTNNEECNKKAYDAFCPEGTKYCYTRHHMNHTSEEATK